MENESIAFALPAMGH